MNNSVYRSNCSATNLLSLLHQERERRWTEFLTKHLGTARLLRWGEEHRVFRRGNEVWKVEWGPASNIKTELGLEHEYCLNALIEGRAQTINPSFSIIDGNWHVLKMDWIDGEDLDQLKDQGRLHELPIVKLICGVFQISLAGIVYKQLRARHTFVRRSGDLAFIDFGGSSRAPPIVALWRNFAPVLVTEGAWQTGRLAGIVIAYLKKRTPRPTKSKNGEPSSLSSHSRAWVRWKQNERRPARLKPQNSAFELGDRATARHLLEMEKHVSKAIMDDPDICSEILTIQTKGYFFAGARDWGFIWDGLQRAVVFADKSVVDLMCGMGGVAAFARLSGAKRVYSYDAQENLLFAAQHLSEAYGFSDNEFHSIDLQSTKPRSSELITALSNRLLGKSRSRVLDIVTNYREIVWLVSDEEWAKRALTARGYATVETIVEAGAGEYILYARDQR